MMYNTIYIDIDGVVRDLTYPIQKQLDKKIFTYKEGGVIFKLVKKNPLLLTKFSTTKYYLIIKKYFNKPVFLSAQIDLWRPYTDIWLKEHFKRFKVIYTYNGEEKLKYLGKNDLLIDDSPEMVSYKKVILINYYYNKQIKNPFRRINNPKELEELLKIIM